MIQSILKHLGGIQQYGVFSLCLFCAIFLCVLLWAFAQKKTHLEYMSRVALDQDQEQSHEKKESHE
jgi:cbb3-type cytochrome oxidase subunit 3